jgi:hypothetical protein
LRLSLVNHAGLSALLLPLAGTGALLLLLLVSVTGLRSGLLIPAGWWALLVWRKWPCGRALRR